MRLHRGDTTSTAGISVNKGRNEVAGAALRHHRLRSPGSRLGWLHRLVSGPITGTFDTACEPVLAGSPAVGSGCRPCAGAGIRRFCRWHQRHPADQVYVVVADFGQRFWRRRRF